MHRNELLVSVSYQIHSVSRLRASRHAEGTYRGSARGKSVVLGLMGLFAALVVTESVLCGPSRAADWVPAAVPFNSALIEAAVLAPSMPERIYVALKRIGVYRSDDRGETWVVAANGLPLDSDIRSLAVAGADADRVFVGIDGASGGPARIFTSGDGGTSWTEISGGIDGRFVSSLLSSSAGPEIILAGLRSGNAPGIYRTTDGGANWSLSVTGPGQGNVWSLAQDPQNPSLLLAGTDDGAVRSTDGGSTWILGTNTGSRFVDLAWSPADSDVVYAAAIIEILRSLDGGATFSPLPNPVAAQGLTEVVAHPTTPLTVFVAGSVYCPPFGVATTVWQSFNQGSSWFEVYTPMDYYEFAGCDRSPAELLIDPSDSEPTLYLGRSGLAEGFWRRNPTGWTLEIAGLRNYGASQVRADHNGAIYARNLTQLLRTQDPGSTWQVFNHDFWTFDLSFEANHSVPGLLHEVGEGASTDVIRLLGRRSTDGGTTWSHDLGDLPPGLPTNAPLTLVVSNAEDGQSVYVWSYARCHRSDDGFDSFLEVSNQIEAMAAVVDPVDPARIFAAQAQSPVVSLSADAGVTWTARSTGLPVETPVAMFIDTEDSAHLVVVLDHRGAFETTDAGASWTSILSTSESIHDADFDPGTGHVYLATQEAGVLTNDPRMMGGGLPTRDVISLTYSPAHDVLIAGTEYAGIFVQPADLSSVDGDAPSGEGGGNSGSLLSTETLHVTASPNPSSRGTTFMIRSPAAGEVEAPRDLRESAGSYLVVRDVNGRLVRRLELTRGAQAWESTWDGRDADLELVPAGVYFVSGRVGSSHASGRLLVLR